MNTWEVLSADTGGKPTNEPAEGPLAIQSSGQSLSRTGRGTTPGAPVNQQWELHSRCPLLHSCDLAPSADQRCHIHCSIVGKRPQQQEGARCCKHGQDTAGVGVVGWGGGGPRAGGRDGSSAPQARHTGSHPWGSSRSTSPQHPSIPLTAVPQQHLHRPAGSVAYRQPAPQACLLSRRR